MMNISGKKLSSFSTEARVTLARENFWSFRKFIHPELIDSWWQVDVAEHRDIKPIGANAACARCGEIPSSPNPGMSGDDVLSICISST
jgi:hypothetical protein